MGNINKTGGPIFHRIFNAAIEGRSNIVRYLLENDPDKNVLYSMAFKEAAEAGHLETVNVFLEHNIEYAQSHLALPFALTHGHIHVFDRLIGLSNTQACNSALGPAAAGGFIDAVKELLKHITHPDLVTDGLEKAAIAGHLDIVELLAPLMPKEKRSFSLVLAISHHHHPIIRHLLPLCDPKDNNSEALQAAVEEHLWDVADQLYPISDPHVAFENLMMNLEEDAKGPAIEYFDKKMFLKQKEVLTKALENEDTNTGKRNTKKM